MPDHYEDTGVFYKFLEDLEEDKREVFLKALDENDLMDFCSSEEEFRVVMGRSPKFEFDKRMPKKGVDVAYTPVTKEMIQERYDEVMKAFPQKPPRTLGEMKKLAHNGDMKPTEYQDMDDLKAKANPKIEINISFNSMKEKAGIVPSKQN